MDSTPTTGLEPRFARELGRQLKALRERRRETEEDVGRRLLMSPNQIRSLEEGDGEPFYGPRYHVQAARKYATMSGLDFDALQAEVASQGGAYEEADEPPAATPFVAGEARQVGRAAGARSSVTAGRRKLAVGAASAIAVAVVALVGVRLMPGPKPASQGSVTTPVAVPQADATPAANAAPAVASPATPPVTAPKAEPDALAATGTASASPAAPAGPASPNPAAPAATAAPNAPAAPERTAGEKAQAAHTGELRIAFSGPTTLQVVRRDGTRQTRNVRAKQTVALKRKDLQTIVIGDWKKATLTSEGKRIDLARFRQAGSSEARLAGTRLRTLGE